MKEPKAPKPQKELKRKGPRLRDIFAGVHLEVGKDGVSVGFDISADIEPKSKAKGAKPVLAPKGE